MKGRHCCSHLYFTSRAVFSVEETTSERGLMRTYNQSCKMLHLNIIRNFPYIYYFPNASLNGSPSGRSYILSNEC